MNPGCRVQDQLTTSEPTVMYIIGRELNLRKLPGRQWESNPQPFEQLRPMTIQTIASTETATTAYNVVYKLFALADMSPLSWYISSIASRIHPSCCITVWRATTRTVHLVGHNGLMASIEVCGLAHTTTSAVVCSLLVQYYRRTAACRGGTATKCERWPYHPYESQIKDLEGTRGRMKGAVKNARRRHGGTCKGAKGTRPPLVTWWLRSWFVLTSGHVDSIKF